MTTTPKRLNDIETFHFFLWALKTAPI